MINLNYRRILWGLAFLLLWGGGLYAQDLSSLRAATGIGGKAGNVLNALNARAAVLGRNRPDFLTIRDNRILINAVATTNTDSLRAQLARAGFIETGVEGRMVSGFLPIANVEQLNDMSFLLEARAVFFRKNNNPISQAVKAQAVEIARQRYGLTGKGVKIGILSDSYNNLGGEAAGIASGNLPGPGNPNGKTTPVQVLQDWDDDDAIDEGRAMAELIHDIVPDAELAFATASNGPAGFAQNIRNLFFQAKCDVIVDDISYFLEPFFQQGVIAQAADAVAGNAPGGNAVYLSSAGNLGDYCAYESPFRLSDTTVTSDDGVTYALHDFDPSPGVDVLQSILIPPFSSNDIILQWDEPFASVCPGCPGASNNVDLWVAGGDSLVFSSASLSTIGGDAVDYYCLDNFTTSPITAELALGYQVSPGTVPPNYVKYVGLNDNNSESILLLEYTVAETGSGTMLGNNSTMVNGFTIAAAPYFNTPAFGVNPPVLEPFSSRGRIGGTPLFFDSRGRRLSEPLILRKPDMTGVDGVNTSFFGSPDFEGDGFPNFFGTSASAPNVAAVVAMMIEANGGRMPSHVVRQLLQSTSLDMDDNRTAGFDRGFDFASGSGLVQADAVIDAMPLGAPTNLRGRPGSGSVELTWTPAPGKLVTRYEVYAVASSPNPIETLVGVTTEPNFTVGNLTNGVTYSFRVRGVAGNGRLTAFTNRVDLRPSIILATEMDANAATKTFLNVYPNPSAGAVNISFREAQVGGTVRIRLSNAAGQEVFVKEVNYMGGVEDAIDTTALPSGMYILSVETEKNVHRRKISIVQ